MSSAWQGRGVGAGLWKDALRRTVQAADIAGIRACAVHAQDERARDFSAHSRFILSPPDPLHFHLLVEDVRRVARARTPLIRLPIGADERKVNPKRVITDIGVDEPSLKKRRRLSVTLWTDLSEPARPRISAVARSKNAAALMK